MRNKRIYHGWIFIQKSDGFKDYFSVQFRGEDDESQTRSMGYGERGAAKAVEFFEQEKGLGAVKLEPTPLGLRVFTWEQPAVPGQEARP